MKLRTLGWAVAVVWAVGMTWALARIAGTLDSLAARSEVRPAAPVAAGPALPSEVAISLRGAAPPPGAVEAHAAPAPAQEAPPPTPEQEDAQRHADELLGQMIAKGGVDDESLESLRQSILAMRPADRMEVLGAFAVAATKGEIKVDPEDYRRILP